MKKKRKYFFIVCLSILSLASFSQTEVDSLKKLLHNAIHDTIRLRLNVALSEVCDEQDILFYANPAVTLADKLLQEENILKNSSLKSKILNQKSLALNNIGIVYRQNGNLPKALEYYELGLKIREEINDKKGISESLNNVADIYNQQGNIPL